ncbi:MAG: hypothetical protein AB1807_15680 [Pseudomonadota bacterium]
MSASAPLFKPFAWVAQKDQADTGRYTMLSNIRDLACGVGVVLAMVERQQLDAERGDAPIVDAADALRLTRMSIASMSMIEFCIDDHFDQMSDLAEASRQFAAQPRGGA